MSTLDLSQTYLGPKGVCCAMEVVRYLPLLRLLNLSGAGIYATDAVQELSPSTPDKVVMTGNECLEVVCNVAATHPSLASLSVFDNGIGTVGGKLLCSLARRNRNIRSIDFGGNNIDRTTQKMILSELAKNCKAAKRRSEDRTWPSPPEADTSDDMEETERVAVASLVESGAVQQLYPGLATLVTIPSLLPCIKLNSAEVLSSVVVVCSGSVTVQIEEPRRGTAQLTVISETLTTGDLIHPFELLAGRIRAVASKEAAQAVGLLDAFSVRMVLPSRGSAACKVHRPHVAEWLDALAARVTVGVPALSKVPWLQSLPWSSLLRVCYSLQTLEVSAGEVVLKQGDVPPGIFFVTSGSVAVQLHLDEVASCEDGDTFGVAELIAQASSDGPPAAKHTYEARCRAQILFLPYAASLRLLQHPAIRSVVKATVP